MFTTAILIAGGRARGRQVPRPLHRRSGLTYLESAVEQALDSVVDEVVVVLGRKVASSREMLEPRSRLRVVVDREHTEKRSALLKAGFQGATDDATAFFVAYADERFPLAQEIDLFLSAASREGKALVLRGGRHGDLFPVLFDRSLKSEMLSDVNDQTLRRVVERDPSRLCLVIGEASPVPSPAKRARSKRPVRRRSRS
jgi:CTP:molybdopterin cytidylyltransferase MocA